MTKNNTGAYAALLLQIGEACVEAVQASGILKPARRTRKASSKRRKRRTKAEMAESKKADRKVRKQKPALQPEYETDDED